MKTETIQISEKEYEYLLHMSPLADQYLNLQECQKCGAEYVDGFPCLGCCTNTPYWSQQQEDNWETKYGK